MYSLKKLSEIIATHLDELTFPERPKELYEPLTYTLESGGKRIRPALLLAACNMFSDDVLQALPVALGFELFHNFTLLHDDIMDNSDKRRNRPTVHKKWNVNQAILSGDALLIEAYRLVAEAQPGLLKQVLDLFNTTAMEVCEGQQYDMDFETRENVGILEYLEMIRLKTAVLLASSLKAGALTGGASINDANLLYEYGTELGLAFQLRDDWLDVYADEALLGKPIGGDIAEAKKTGLYIELLQLADDDDTATIRKYFGDATSSRDEKISTIRAFYDKYGVGDRIESRAETHFAKAISALDRLSVREEKKTVLFDFGKQIMKREK